MQKREKNGRESGAGLALAVLLQNILILLVLGGCAWMLLSLFEQNDSFSVLLRGGFLR